MPIPITGPGAKAGSVGRCCRTCRFMTVNRDFDGKQRIRANNIYPCAVELPAPPDLPDSFRYLLENWRVKQWGQRPDLWAYPRSVSPDGGKHCSGWQPLAPGEARPSSPRPANEAPPI